ncbi:hypothetical protein [Biomaibacter acetigenes]|uniref:hypothetical protein n=1 Tax=Biomaibacter acetigenes TaxID=2316383 RepID=UPI0013CEDEA7|nr:hypothetical protein [Biomaibacter acetigenes]
MPLTFTVISTTVRLNAEEIPAVLTVKFRVPVLAALNTSSLESKVPSLLLESFHSTA